MPSESEHNQVAADPDPDHEFSSAIHSEHDHDHSAHQDHLDRSAHHDHLDRSAHQGHIDRSTHHDLDPLGHGKGRHAGHHDHHHGNPDEHHLEHEQEEVPLSGALPKHECGCGNNCNSALREYLRDCFDPIPALKKCDCGNETNETSALADPALKDPAKCIDDDCDFCFAPDPNCKCPPMPSCDYSDCRPSWMPCQAPSFKHYPEPEGVEIKPYSAGYSGRIGNIVKDCPMEKLFRCNGVVMDGQGQEHHDPSNVHGMHVHSTNGAGEEKRGILCAIKNKFNRFFGRNTKSSDAGGVGTGTGTGTQECNICDLDVASDQNENHQDQDHDTGAGAEDKDKEKEHK